MYCKRLNCFLRIKRSTQTGGTQPASSAGTADRFITLRRSAFQCAVVHLVRHYSVAVQAGRSLCEIRFIAYTLHDKGPRTITELQSRCARRNVCQSSRDVSAIVVIRFKLKLQFKTLQNQISSKSVQRFSCFRYRQTDAFLRPFFETNQEKRNDVGLQYGPATHHITTSPSPNTCLHNAHHFPRSGGDSALAANTESPRGAPGYSGERTFSCATLRH
jgi:hypothetical protein